MSGSSVPIVVSGAGLITPLGLSRAQTWAAVRAGRCGMGPMGAMESPLPAGAEGGQAPDLPGDFAPRLPRESRYLRYAVLQAMQDAGIEPQLPCAPERVALVLGTTLHGMRAGGEFFRRNDPAALRDFLAGAVVRNACGDLPFHGGAMTTCSACSSSLGAIALAVTLLRKGELDLIVAGGYDTISEYVWGGFNSLRLVASGPPRPFTRNRQGMKLAEGYGIVVLERASDAHARRARPIATVLGFGESADAHHLTQPHPAGDGAARAMEQALASAGLMPAEIDLVAAHATGTPDNDAAEFAALSRVFGTELSRVPVVAFKSQLGHTLGGAGAVELILAVTAMREQTVPACANVAAGDVEFAGLNLATGTSRPARIRATLNTSLGFGGANTCVILGPPSEWKGEAPAEPGRSIESPLASDSTLSSHAGPPPVSVMQEDRLAVSQSARGTDGAPIAKPQAAPPTAFPAGASSPSVPDENARRRLGRSLALPTRDVFITGIGVVLPGAVGNDAFLRRLTAGADPLGGEIPDADFASLLNARRVRRMSQYVKLSLAATVLCLQDAGITDVPAFAESCAAVLGTTHGSTNYCEQYYGQIVREGVVAANPMLFAEGVPNAAAAHLSLMLSLKGPCQTIIGTLTAGLDAIRVAAARIATGEWERAIVGAAEEFSPTVNDAHARCESSIAPGAVIGSGAVTFL
ncbi:MAG TPA: beta-ketoacyl-[acyl-carrier-protein] synthase family protein, partial [Tepidisphaeraceae bacterium]